MRLTNFSALSRSSNTAAQVVTSVRPSTTAWKSGALSRDQCASGFICRDGRIAPPCLRVAEIDRPVLDRDLQEPPQPVERVLLLERPLARHRKDDEVVVEALGAAESMQRVRHLVTTFALGA